VTQPAAARRQFFLCGMLDSVALFIFSENTQYSCLGLLLTSSYELETHLADAVIG
jgi:hypothetical protein